MGGGEKGGSTFEEESEMIRSGPVRVEIPFRPQREMRRDSRSTRPERSCRCVLFVKLFYFLATCTVKDFEWNDSM